MNLTRIVNSFHTSNTYLIETGQNNWVVIDPGWSPQQLDDWISRQQPRIIAVMLTHEHADHCAGANVLLEKYPVPLFCTVACKNGIANSKHNFSAYIAEIPVFEIQKPVITAEDGQKIKLGEYDFTFVATPGHSPGGMCIITGDCVFTGDTLLNQTKTPLNFPHSNKNDYFQSIERLKTLIRHEMIIYPGHGEPFKI